MPLLDLDLYRKEISVATNPPVRLSVVDAGPRAAERALVFVHGFGGYAMQWEQQLVEFADKNRVVAMDLRGHGLSDRPTSKYTVDELVGDLEHIVDTLALPPQFVLLGHSFGGALAAAYTVKHPDRVERLILVSTSVDFKLNPLVKLAVSASRAISRTDSRAVSESARRARFCPEGDVSERALEMERD